jgi:hypothetical protein
MESGEGQQEVSEEYVAIIFGANYSSETVDEFQQITQRYIP